MIVIAMMHREFCEILPGEFPTAAPTDPGIHFQRLFSIGFCPRILMTAIVGNDFIKFIFRWVLIHTALYREK